MPHFSIHFAVTEIFKGGKTHSTTGMYDIFHLPISDIIFWNRNWNRSQNSWNRNRSHVNILKWSRNGSRNQNARVESESESEPGPSGTAHLCNKIPSDRDHVSESDRQSPQHFCIAYLEQKISRFAPELNDSGWLIIFTQCWCNYCQNWNEALRIRGFSVRMTA